MMHSQVRTRMTIQSKEDHYYHSVNKPLIWTPQRPARAYNLAYIMKIRNRKLKAILSKSEITWSGRTKEENTMHTKRIINCGPSKYLDNGAALYSFNTRKKSTVGGRAIAASQASSSVVEELKKLQPAAETTSKEGLGIVEFLKGQNILITGATGFLAKVLVEKILRVQPDVGHIFLLIRATDAHSARGRLKNEITDTDLFKLLRERHGESYEGFMEGKLTPVVGDIGEDNLGIDCHTTDALRVKVDIIVNSAASTAFDERYDHALNLNTKGPQRILEFAKSCPHLQLFMHMSTAFVNGERKGLVHEQTLKIGCSITNETLNKGENMTSADINVENELNLVQKKMSDALSNTQITQPFPLTPRNDHHKEKFLIQTMKDLGMERAKLFGWQDTYVFTKAMGEMLVDSKRDQLPVVIMRPSVVESSFKEPFPGWMEGNRMMDPIIISYGKGQLPTFLCDPNNVLDVVPVDMVTNAMLAAMVKHACKPGLEVYQVGSSVVNPLIFSELARMSYEHFEEHPFIDRRQNPIRIKKMDLVEDINSFMDDVSNFLNIKEIAQSSSNGKCLDGYSKISLKIKEQATYLANIYQPYTFYAGRFDTSKTQQLYANLSSQEKKLFGFNIQDIDWELYIKRIHIPGIKKHVLKGRGST